MLHPFFIMKLILPIFFEFVFVKRTWYIYYKKEGVRRHVDSAEIWRDVRRQH